MSALPVLGLAVGGEQGVSLLPPRAELSPLQDLVTRTGARFLLLGGSGPRVDASVLAGVLRARWGSGGTPGLVLAAAPTRDHPYNLARRVLALDHFTDGRAGVALLTTDRGTAAASAPGASTWTVTPEGPALTREFADVVRGLWNTWPRESVVSDAPAGVFADARRIRRLDHVGSWSVRGPLNSPSSPQGEPLLAWWIRSGTAGRFPAAEFATAAAVADVVLLPADRVPRVRPEPAVGSEPFAGSGPGRTRVVAVVADVDPRRALRELADRDWLDGVVLDARTPLALAPEGTVPVGATLRGTLGVGDRSIDLTDREPAFGSPR